MSEGGTSRRFTSKQMGYACEMLVAAELTLAGVPTLLAPENWPGYDLVAQMPDGELAKISVKSRTFKKGSAFVDYRTTDVFDWLAIVILGDAELHGRRIYLVPRPVADAAARSYNGEKVKDLREYRIDEVHTKFSAYENNFSLIKMM